MKLFNSIKSLVSGSAAKFVGLKYKSMAGLLTFSLFALAGCTDDLEIRNSLPDTDDNTLTILMPNVEAAAEYGASRGNGDYDSNKDLADEAKINNLWFFAFPQGSTSSDLKIVKNIQGTASQIKFAGQDDSNNSSYTSYTVTNVSGGDYKIYLLANFEGYVNKPNGYSDYEAYFKSLSESDLKELVLNFRTNNPTVGNLPMYCLHKDIKTSADATNGIGESANFTFNKNSKQIYADLTFMCAKVRYTILFDKTPNSGFSKTFTSTVSFKDPKAKKIVDKVAITGTASGASTFDLNSIDFEEKNYPDDGSELLKEKPTKFEQNLTKLQGNYDANKRAWQGTIYLPENPVSGDARTTLYFTGEGNQVSTTADAYILPLFNDNGITLERGKFYDVIAKVTTPNTVDLESSLNVTEWDPKNLMYELHGPYELIVEKTTIGVNTNTFVTMGYDSDVQVTFVSPVYEGRDVYTIETVTDDMLDENDQPYQFDEKWPYHLRIMVNPDITLSEITDIQNKKMDEYSYFNIVAGNLKKMIKINPLEISPIFDVSPNDITIDLRECVSDNKNTVTYKITCKTNLPVKDGELTLEGANELLNGISNSGQELLKLKVEGTNVLEGTGTTLTIKQQVTTFVLTVSNLTSGNSFWETERTYTLTFEHTDADEDKTPQKVKITIKPFTTDYVIHFKDKSGEWDDPHIYIYQCLELPSNLVGTNSKYAGRTVGYKDGDGKEDDGTTDKDLYAGLEYAFTNNISFKGWIGYGGSCDPNEGNTVFENGFVHMGGYDSDNSRYYKATAYQTDKYDYTTNLNFNHFAQKDTQKNNFKCTKCSADNLNKDNNGNTGKRGWPGVMMIKEENGWWKYTLTGIATPGKAMIMFTNVDYQDHSKASHGETYRYPNHAEVGIPLFDFPNREGWFLFDQHNPSKGGTFVAKNPDTNPSTPGTDPPADSFTYRIYWPKSVNGGNSYLYVWSFGNEPLNDQKWWDWNDCQNHQEEDPDYPDYYYAEYTCTTDYGTSIDTFGFKFRYNTWESSNREGDLIKDSFEKVEDHLYVATVGVSGSNPNSITKGYPTNSGSGSTAYRLYWPKAKGEYIHLMVNGNAVDDVAINGNGWNTTVTRYDGTYLDYYYYRDFSYTGDPTTATLTYKYYGVGQNEGSQDWTAGKLSNFSTGNIRYAYINSPSTTANLVGQQPTSNPLSGRNYYEVDDLLIVGWGTNYSGSNLGYLFVEKLNGASGYDPVGAKNSTTNSKGKNYCSFRVKGGFVNKTSIIFTVGDTDSNAWWAANKPVPFSADCLNKRDSWDLF